MTSTRDGAIKSIRPQLPGISFRTKITGLSVAITVGAIALAISVFILQAWLGDRTNLASSRLAFAEVAARDSLDALQAGDPKLAKKVVDDFERSQDLRSGTIYTVDGRPLVHWGVGKPTATSLNFVSLSAHGTAFFHDGELEVHAPVLDDGQHLGELVLISSQAEVDRNLLRNVSFGLLLFIGATLLAGALAFWLSGRVLTPLNRLAGGIEEVRNTKDFTVYIEPSSTDEFGWLTTRFNALISELQTNDEALRSALKELTEARDAADAANVMKSQFLANMSHEIRTPLNGVLGMAQVMALHPMAAAQKERLDVIQRSGESLLAILNDLLDLSKIEAGKLELEEAPFDLSEIASGAHAAFTSIANNKGVSFNLEIADNARGVWRGDSVRVRQILYNLISNALKFTVEGHVRVVIDATQCDGAKALHARVIDTGIGIATDKLASLFDKFVQADSSTTRRFGGTGLGLSICRELALLMGGSITVESTEGMGTTFDVLLPLKWLSGEITRIVRAPEAQSAKPASDVSRLKVLAAEDNTTNQIVLKTILHSVGLEPLIVDNGREAVEAWTSGQFDLILMDIQMPILDGVAATKVIRAQEAERGLAPIAIVALSANAMKHQVDDYLAAGMDAHLAKPIQLEKLYGMLQAVADSISETDDQTADRVSVA